MVKTSLTDKILSGKYLTKQGNASTLKGQLATIPEQSERYQQIQKAIKVAEESELLYLKESVRNLPENDWNEMMQKLRMSLSGKYPYRRKHANLFIDIFYRR